MNSLVSDSLSVDSLPIKAHLPNLFVVLPAYNEGEGLTKLVFQIQEMKQDYPCRIIVVDDGSSDDSIPYLEQALQTHMAFAQVVILRHAQNSGLGEALRTGFQYALSLSTTENDMIFVMDSDCTHPPFLINRMATRILEGNDVVIASRYQYGSRVIGLSPIRHLYSHGASWLFRLMLPIPQVKDYTCGYRAYRVSKLCQALERYGERFITESGFSCMAEILLKLHRCGAIMTELPLVLRYDQKMSTSKLKVVRTIWRTLGLLFSQRSTEP